MNNHFQKTDKSSNEDTTITKYNNLVNPDKMTSDSGKIEKLKDFCGYTTAHGLGRLVESKGYARRCFWVMACVGAFAMFTSQVVLLAGQYASKPVQTYITMKYARNIDFPVVTICNHNVIRGSKVFTNDSAILQEYLRNLLNASSKGENSRDPSQLSTSKHKVKRDIFQNFSQMGETNHSISIQPTSIISSSTTHAPLSATVSLTATPSSSTTSKTRMKKNKKGKKTAAPSKEKKKKNRNTEEDEGPLTDYVTRQERLHMALATWPDEELAKLGHQFKGMFRDCTYRGRSCLKSRFWDTFWHYKYGNCFSFNKNNGLMAGGPGPAYGLLLEINVEQNEYVGDLTKDAGIRVQIENKGKVPFPYEKGFSVGPGSATSVGIRKVKIKRADPFNNGSCMGKDGLKNDNLFLLKHNASYSTIACRESCLSETQKATCGCREYRFPKDASKNESVCDIFNATVEKCLAGIMNKYRKSNLGCSRKCPSPCNENVYKLTISTSRFPSLAYERILLADKKKLEKRNIPPSDLSSYLLQLNIFFEELNYEVIEEHMGYGLVNFISDIGGNVGMWIGVSVLTIAEIMELLCIIIHHAIKNCTQLRGSKVQAVK